VLLLIWITSTVSLLGLAQTPWNVGVVVLKDNRVIVGDVHYKSDVLLTRIGGEITVYPAHLVSSFRFYDAKENINRHYLSLRNPSFIFPVLDFYEVVTWGEVSVVRRDNYPLLSNSRNEDEYTYFSWYENELISLKKFRSHIYPHLAEQYPLQIKQLLTSQNLNPNHLPDAIRIVKFYNQQVHARISIAAL